MGLPESSCGFSLCHISLRGLFSLPFQDPSAMSFFQHIDLRGPGGRPWPPAKATAAGNPLKAMATILLANESLSDPERGLRILLKSMLKVLAWAVGAKEREKIVEGCVNISFSPKLVSLQNIDVFVMIFPSLRTNSPFSGSHRSRSEDLRQSPFLFLECSVPAILPAHTMLPFTSRAQSQHPGPRERWGALPHPCLRRRKLELKGSGKQGRAELVIFTQILSISCSTLGSPGRSPEPQAQ